MESRASTPRREPERSLTWPPTLPAAENDPPLLHKGDPPFLSVVQDGENALGIFEEDLENNPECHFLSPVQMYEYEDWAEDDDSDGEEVEWDAGITDFALFDDDRRRAQEDDGPLPSKWSGLLAQQTSAYERAVARQRRESDSLPVGKLLSASDQEVPSLTPDVSPDLRDDLEVDLQIAFQPTVPNYLTITVTPPEEEDDDHESIEDGSLPFSYYVRTKQQPQSQKCKVERPGLRHSRTMSGRAHTWTRPSMLTVSEDSEAEERAERAGYADEVVEVRGRRRDC